jgi:hypothetical protein
MTFLFRWKHADGSIVEFSERGWRSDDPEKNDWLIKTSELCSSFPVAAPAIRIWLQENCQLVQFTGPDADRPTVRIHYDSSSEGGKPKALARATNGSISPNFSNRGSLFRPAKNFGSTSGGSKRRGTRGCQKRRSDRAKTERSRRR